MRKKLSFIFLVFLLSSKAFSQPQDSLYTTDSDSLDLLTEGVVSDTLSIAPAREFVRSDQFRDELVRRFSLSGEIASEDIDNSIGESFGEILDMRTLIEIVKIGSAGQLEIGSFGGNTRGFNISIDGQPFQQQDLYFPHKGNTDLNSVLLSNISKVEFLPAGLAGLWGNGGGALGLGITTKDFDGVEPYSRVTANRGPSGFHRTQVELGRGLTSRGKFYLTTEFKKSDGYLVNDDYDGMSLSGKTTFNLKRGMDLKLSAYQYKTEMGLPPFPGASFQDTRKKVDDWGVMSSIILQENRNSVLDLNLHYGKQNQEIKSKAYGFESKKIEEMFGLTATQTLRLKGTHHAKIKGWVERKSLDALTRKDAVYGGHLLIADLFRLSPTVVLFLSSRLGKEEGLDADISACGAVSYAISKDVNLFWTLGRSVGYPTLMDRFWLPLSVGFKDTIKDYMEEGNRSLKSQKSFVADFGTAVEKKNYKIGAYLFGSIIDDFIFWSNADTTIYYGHFKPLNSEATIWGVNFDLSFEFLNHMKSYISYSFKQGKDSNRKIKLPHSPEHSLFSYIQFENEFLKREIGLKLRLETNIVSERFMDEYEQDKAPGRAILNGKITIRFLDFHFHYVIRNITDRTYRLTGDYFMPKRSFWWGFYWEFFD